MVVQAAVQDGSGYIPIGWMCKIPKASPKTGWFRRNSERYVQIPQRRLDKLGRMSARAKILKADFDFLQT